MHPTRSLVTKNSLHQCPPACGSSLCAFPSSLSSPVLTHPHPPPHCGSAHTWPSQIRALENQRAERKAGCMAEQEEGRGGCLVHGVFQHSDGAKS